MTSKHKGVCPFCNIEMIPSVIEENTIRRDKCQCPDCGKYVYVCRTPGCRDYSKGGDIYDDELCPSCTSAIGGSVGSLGGLAIGAVITALISKKMG